MANPLNTAGDVVDRDEDRREEDGDAHRERHDHERLDEGDERIDGVIHLTTIEFRDGIEDATHIPRLLADLYHRHHDAWDLRVLAERFRDRKPCFHVDRRLLQDALVRRILDDRTGDLQAAQHLDTALEHRREIVGEAREIELLIDAADDRDLQARSREDHLPRLGLDIAIEEERSQDEEDAPQQGIVREHVADADDDTGIDRDRLPYLFEHGRE